MDRFRELSTFVAVAEAGAFTAAARQLNMSPPAVTRLVSALEARLGARLLTRTTRQVKPTAAGERLLQDASRVLAELAAAEAAARGAQAAPQGELRVTAPVIFGRRFLVPILRDYIERHPAVTVRALFLDRTVDLIDEGLDVALRIGDLPDSALSATRVGAVRRVTVAAPDYLARHGAPEAPEALNDHRIILPTGASEAPRWDYVVGRSRQSVRLAPAFSVNSLEAAIESAEAGWGITRVLSYQVADALAAGRLVELLPGRDDRLMPIHLLQAEGRRAAAKIRAFIELAAQRLRRDAARLAAQ